VGYHARPRIAELDRVDLVAVVRGLMLRASEYATNMCGTLKTACPATQKLSKAERPHHVSMIEIQTGENGVATSAGGPMGVNKLHGERGKDDDTSHEQEDDAESDDESSDEESDNESSDETSDDESSDETSVDEDDDTKSDDESGHDDENDEENDEENDQAGHGDRHDAHENDGEEDDLSSAGRRDSTHPNVRAGPKTDSSRIPQTEAGSSDDHNEHADESDSEEETADDQEADIGNDQENDSEDEDDVAEEEVEEADPIAKLKLSKEGQRLIDIIYDMATSHPAIIPTLHSVAQRIIAEYNPTTSEEKKQLYYPLQIFRIFFDLVERLHRYQGKLGPHQITNYSLLLSQILITIKASFKAPFPEALPEFRALTKASEMLDRDDMRDGTRRIELVKALLGMADLYVLLRVHKGKHDGIAQLNELLSVIEKFNPEDKLTGSLHVYWGMKNKIWITRSDLFKNGALHIDNLEAAYEDATKLIDGETEEHSQPDDDSTESAETESAETDEEDFDDE